ncbi:MAG: nucleotide pyrophosphohydrolase [Veillonella sp.]|nr:nucleotide pyrophosphohydrolase [Veillonella sp.]
MDRTDELMAYIADFCKKRDWDQFHNPKDLAIGLSTEANELLDIFRFKTDAQMKAMMEDPEKRKEISGELADVFFFILRFAQMNDFDLFQCVADKMAYNEERYAVEKVKGKNLKYTEYEE